MEKECLNCGATEQNWKKSCAGCNGEFCYKCIDEHFCHPTSMTNWQDEFDKEFNDYNWCSCSGEYANASERAKVKSFISSEKQLSYEEGKAEGVRILKELASKIKLIRSRE